MLHVWLQWFHIQAGEHRGAGSTRVARFPNPCSGRPREPDSQEDGPEREGAPWPCTSGTGASPPRAQAGLPPSQEFVGVRRLLGGGRRGHVSKGIYIIWRGLRGQNWIKCGPRSWWMTTREKFSSGRTRVLLFATRTSKVAGTMLGLTRRKYV